MKASIFTASVILCLFLWSMTTTGRQDASVQQDTTSQGSAVDQKAAAIMEKIDDAEKKDNERYKKYDSLIVEKDKNISSIIFDKNRIARANRRFEFLISKMNADSVKKYEVQYIDAEENKEDTIKKKIEYPEVNVPTKRKTLFRRIFDRKRQ